MFFFNDTATTEICTLSLHDALPIFLSCLNSGLYTASRMLFVLAAPRDAPLGLMSVNRRGVPMAAILDRKSTRLNSSHANILYAVFPLTKKLHSIDLITCYSTMRSDM